MDTQVSKAINIDVVTLDSREVAKMLEKEHKLILRDIEGSKDRKGILKILTENQMVPSDFFIESSYRDCSGKINKSYKITKMGCEILGNKQQGEKGILFTAKYVKRFNQMEQALKEMKPKLPTTYKEALQQLLIEVEEKEQLQLENQEMKPKAEYFDALVDRNLLTNVRDTAKELGVKERVFTRWLVQNKFCYRDKRNKLKPYAEKKKYFELKEFATQYGHADVQMLINPKGREAFRLLLIKDGLIASDYEQVCMIG